MSDGPIVVWGEVLWDRFVDRHPPLDVLGGAPANVAWHLGQLGQWAVLATRVGNDSWGDKAIADLSAFVDPALIVRDPTRATGEVRITVESGEPTYQLVRDRAWEFADFDDEVAAALAEASALVYGTLAQRQPSAFAAWQQAVAAAPPGCMIVCDPNLRGSQREFSAHEREVLLSALQAANVVKLNDRELATLARLISGDALQWLLQQPPHLARVVALTHGDRGSTVYRSDRGKVTKHEIPAFAATPGGDNIGCGDAYVAGLLHGMLSGAGLVESATLASRLAAQVASVVGATPFLDAELLELLLARESGAQA